MTDTEINIAIAEASGWKWSKPYYGHDGVWHSSPYKGDDIWDSDISDWAGKPHDVVRDVGELRDYCYDLNAMHEAEMTLTDEQLEVYSGFFLYKGGISAIARQRAEAFLQTLGLLRK